MSEYKPHLAQPTKPERGCFFYGCLTAAVLAVILGIGVGYLGYVFYGYFQSFSEGLEESPSVIVAQPMGLQAEQNLLHRITMLRNELDRGLPVRLLLNSEELTYLAQQSISQAVAEGAKDSELPIKVSLESGNVIVDFSVPINGKFLNGRAEFDIEIGQETRFRVVNLDLNGRPISGVIKDMFKDLESADPLKFISESDEYSDVVDRIETLKVEGDQIIIEFKAKMAT